MKKNRLFVIFAVLTLALTFACFAGCGENGRTTGNKHILSADLMDTKGILDDGGKIIGSDPVSVVSGVNWVGRRQVVLGEDTSRYSLNGGASLAKWAATGCYRVQNTGEKNTVFTLDFSYLENVEHVGISLSLIASRANTCISVSTDGAEWTDIGYAEQSRQAIKCDYNRHLTSMLGVEVADANLYELFYELGQYMGESKVIYVRAGYTENYWLGLPSKGVGADIIGCVNYYDKLELVWSTL